MRGGRPSKHETSTQCWAIVSSPSETLSQHYPSIGLACRVWHHAECWPASQTAGQLRFGSTHHAGICYASPPLTRQRVGVTCISPMPGHVYDAGQHLKGIGAVYTMWTHTCLHEVLTRTEWILVSTGEAGPTVNRHWVDVSLYSPLAVSTA